MCKHSAIEKNSSKKSLTAQYCHDIHPHDTTEYNQTTTGLSEWGVHLANMQQEIWHHLPHCPSLMLMSHLECMVSASLTTAEIEYWHVPLTWLLGWEVIAEDETKEADNNLSLSNLDSSPGTSGHKGHDSSGNFHLQSINIYTCFCYETCF